MTDPPMGEAPSGTARVTARSWSRYRPVARASLLLAVAIGGAACGRAGSPHAASSGATTGTTRTDPAVTVQPGSADSLSAPATTAAEDAEYLTDVARADPVLATYVQGQGNVALRALLTDGSAFCAFLRRGGGLDNAMVSVAIGARSVESQTHLPSTVTTFNTVEAVALLRLCPAEQALVPASVRTRIHDLGVALVQPAADG